MKSKFAFILLVWGLLLFLPALLTVFFSTEGTSNEITKTRSMMVQIKKDEASEVVQIDFEKYLVGVVAAEMPVTYDMQALEAQAIAARTYAIKKLIDHDGDYVFSNNPSEGQAYYSNDVLKSRWGYEQYPTFLERIQNAVDTTNGLIMVYDNQPIQAVFHAVSAGKTQDTESIWNFSLPYLKSVDSIVDSDATSYSKQVELKDEEIKLALKNNIEGIQFLDISMAEQIQIIKRNEAGYVGEIQIGNKIINGEVFRNILGLNSSNLILKKSEEGIIFETKGYGHGVGMSQFGANKMAEEGKKYEEILQHYYTDIKIKKINYSEYSR